MNNKNLTTVLCVSKYDNNVLCIAVWDNLIDFYSVIWFSTWVTQNGDFVNQYYFNVTETGGYYGSVIYEMQVHTVEPGSPSETFTKGN